MWRRLFLWPDIAKPCSGDERGEKWLTEWRRVYYAQEGKYRFFINMMTVLALSSLFRDYGGLLPARGTPRRQDSGAKFPEMARPLHNSGLKAFRRRKDYLMVSNFPLKLTFRYALRCELVSAPELMGQDL
jgi:hypothetical protein